MVSPWYKEAATLLKPRGIQVGAMDMDLYGDLGRSYGVTGMPHIMAFLPGDPENPVGMGGLGVQAWEGYRKDGVKSPQFIVFSGLFAVFYASNIYGSVTQAKAYNVQLVTDFKQTVGIQVNLSFDRLFTP